MGIAMAGRVERFQDRRLASYPLPPIFEEHLLEHHTQEKSVDLNELVLQAVFYLSIFVHEGTKIECELTDAELYVAGDSNVITAVLEDLLEAMIRTLQPLPDEAPLVNMTIRTGVQRTGEVFLDICCEGVLAQDDPNAPNGLDAMAALFMGHHDLSAAERIIQSNKGRLAVGALKSKLCSGLKISVTLPCVNTFGENRISNGMT